MQIQVKKYLDGQVNKWNSIPAINRYKNSLDENLEAIKQKQGKGKDSVSVTQTKNELKELASFKAAILAGGVAAYAADQEDNELASVADLTVSGLNKLPEPDFRAPIDALVSAAETHLKDLADQGISKEQLTELQTTLDDFDELIGNPRQIQISSALISREISELIKASMDLLNDQLDKSMLRYKLTDPTFYEGYERSRVIVG